MSKETKDADWWDREAEFWNAKALGAATRADQAKYRSYAAYCKTRAAQERKASA